jgi:hypothetical protein
MSNIVRGPQEYLLNTLVGADLGMYVNTEGKKVLVFKKLGIEIPESTGTRAVINEAISGNLKQVKVVIDWLWNGEKSHDFVLEVTKQPLVDGFTHRQYPVIRTYSYRMNNFTTVDAGTLNDTDKNTIVAGLLAAVAADVQLSASNVNTGAFVTGAQFQEGSPLADVPGAFTLTAKESLTDFTVRIWDDEFTQTLVTPFRRSTITYDDLVRRFGIRAQNEGKYPTSMPISGTTYMHVVITQRTEGYDNVVASGQITREQVYHFYMPVSIKTAVEFATVTNSGTNTNTMADTVGSKAKTFKDYLVYLCGAANVIDN